MVKVYNYQFKQTLKPCSKMFGMYETKSSKKDYKWHKTSV